MKNLISFAASLAIFSGVGFSTLAYADNMAYATDPVGKMSELTKLLAKHAKELEAVANELDKVSEDLDKVEKLPPKSVSPERFKELEGRFTAAVKRSEDVERKIGTELDQDLVEIKKVKKTLETIAKSRKSKNKSTAQKTDSKLSDAELAECLKDIAELEKSALDLKRVVSEDSEPGQGKEK